MLALIGHFPLFKMSPAAEGVVLSNYWHSKTGFPTCLAESAPVCARARNVPVGALVAFLKESPLHLGAATLSLVLAYHSIARRESAWLRISPVILSVGHCVRTDRMFRVGDWMQVRKPGTRGMESWQRFGVSESGTIKL